MKHRGVEGSKNSQYDTIMINMCHYIFVQTHRLYDAE